MSLVTFIDGVGIRKIVTKKNSYKTLYRPDHE